MKILLVSNAPWAATGYGTQGYSLAKRLLADGHQVSYACNYGLHGGVVNYNGITCLPFSGDDYRDTIIYGHIRSVQPDLLISLFDVWAWKGEYPLPVGEDPIRWAAWTPVDTQPISKANLGVLRKVTYPIAMAEFAHKEMEANGIKSIFIPHGVEKDFGFTEAGRSEWRRYLQIPDDGFLFTSVGLNRYYPGRKMFDRLIAALAKVPDAYLYLHTSPVPQAGSLDLEEVATFYGVRDRVRFADPFNYVMGYSQNGMNALYSGADCYVQPTNGEGFGIPVIEAQACGLPVIATDCTSMPELCCPTTSELVKATPFMVPDYSHRFLIDVDDLAQKMNEAVKAKAGDEQGWLNMRARAGIWANQWDWDRVYAEGWRPFLAEVEREVTEAPRREQQRGKALVFEHEGKMRKTDSTLASPAVQKELELLKTLDHPNIIPVLAHGKDDRTGVTWFDMPLYHTLNQVNPETITDAQRDTIIDGVKSALTYLHDLHLAHRDVHPSNVVLDENWNPYLIDFEWAHPCDADLSKSEPCVDLEPWRCLDAAVPSVQMGADQRGLHTIVSYLRKVDLTKSHATGLPGVPYQAIDGVGERDPSLRWPLLQPDVKGKRVLDLGCNLGYFASRALDEGAISAVGIDQDAAVLDAARVLHPEVTFMEMNLEQTMPPANFDVVFCLSVFQHLSNITQRRLVDFLRTAEAVYFEAPGMQEHDIAAMGFEVEYLGESERGRNLFKLTSKTKEATYA